MKIKLIALSVLLLNIGLTSCSKTDTKNNSTATTTEASPTTVEKTIVEKTKSPLLFEEVKSKSINLKKEDSIINFNVDSHESLYFYSNDYLYFSKNEDDGTQFGKPLLSQFNIKDKTKKELKNITMPSMSNDPFIPVVNEIYCLTGFFRDPQKVGIVKYDFNNDLQEDIYTLDPNKSDITILYTSNTKDNNIPEFFIAETTYVTDTELIYTYEKIIPKTNETFELFTKNYKISENITHNATATNNNLIILDSTINDSKSEYNIDSYDFDGNKISTTPIQLDDFLTSQKGRDTLRDVYMYNDKLILFTMANRLKIFNLEDGVYKSYTIDTNFDTQLFNFPAYLQPVDLGYLYFTNENSEFVIFDLNQNKTYKKPLTYDDTTFKPISLFSNPNGDICIEFCNMETATEGCDYYYNIVKVDDLLNNLE